MLYTIDIINTFNHMDLLQKKCVPCEGGVPALNAEDSACLLQEVKDWQIKEGKLEREIKFKDFKESIEFINKVAELAEEEGHHPDMLLYSWNRVRLSLFTHAIRGLSENDFILARKINNIKE